MRSGKYRTRKAAIEAGLRLLVLSGQTKIGGFAVKSRGMETWKNLGSGEIPTNNLCLTYF